MKSIIYIVSFFICAPLYGQYLTASYSYQITSHEDFEVFSGGQLSYDLLFKHSVLGVNGVFLASENNSYRNGQLESKKDLALEYGFNVDFRLAFFNNEKFNLSYGPMLGLYVFDEVTANQSISASKPLLGFKLVYMHKNLYNNRLAARLGVYYLYLADSGIATDVGVPFHPAFSLAHFSLGLSYNLQKP